MVPESTSLTAERNFIDEGRIGADGASIDEGFAFLEDVLLIEEDTVEVEGCGATHGWIGL